MTKDLMLLIWRLYIEEGRTCGETAAIARVVPHVVDWCAWLRHEPIDEAVRLFTRMTLEVRAPLGRGGLAWLRQHASEATKAWLSRPIGAA